MQIRLVVIVIFLVSTCVSLPVFSHGLPKNVQQALKKSGVPESAIGVYVHQIDAAQPILAVNADASMNPASVMKLVTTFAGLELLGPAYTWQTQIYANGKLEDGVLLGDLVVKGYGDPKLNLENFWLLVNRLRQTGLREITGDLILDQTHFDIPNDDPGAFDGRPYRTYNILPEALLVNYRTSALNFTPQPNYKTVRVVVEPASDSFLLVNNLKLTQGRCGNWRRLLGMDISVDKNSRVSVKFDGSFSINCGKKSYNLGLQDSSTYTRDLFKRLWVQHGGSFRGNVLLGMAPTDISPLKVYQSPPLTEIIRGINKFSNNIAARQLYLTLGTVNTTSSSNSSATLAKSDRAIKQWLASRQLSFPDLVIENGSGLSRKERISAKHMGKLLLAAFQSPVMPEFISSMPIAGVDGTMKNRFTRSAVSGLAHIKTGSLNQVRAFAGYMLDKSGRRFAVVFFVNHPNSSSAQVAMDTLLQWLYARP